jgi:hypothetical protein
MKWTASLSFANFLFNRSDINVVMTVAERYKRSTAKTNIESDVP